MYSFANNYREFISLARTELSTVQQVVKLAKDKGFKTLKADSKIKARSHYFDINRSRAIALIVVGKKAVAG